METKALNRDIKRLARNFEKAKNNLDMPEYFEYIDETVKPEFKRLFDMDKGFEYISRDSILILLSMNISLRIVPLHVFGSHINLTNLI